MTPRFLIIGGTRGIGRATAERLAQGGASVTVAARKQPETPLPAGIDFIPVDVTAPEPGFDAVPETLHGLLYAPGSINLRPFRNLTLEAMQKDWDINVSGAVRCVQALLPNLKRAGQASIVLFSTVAVRQGMPFHASIAAAKGAVEGLTRSLAAELAPGIRVNCVAPSMTATTLAGPLLANDKRREQIAARHPMKRIGAPEDIAAASAFLLSDQSGWMTGQVIGVDGGLSTLRN